MSEQKSSKAVAPEPAPNPKDDAIIQYLAIKGALEGSKPRWSLPSPDPRTDFGRVEAPSY